MLVAVGGPSSDHTSCISCCVEAHVDDLGTMLKSPAQKASHAQGCSGGTLDSGIDRASYKEFMLV